MKQRRSERIMKIQITAATGAYAVPSPQGGGVDQSSSPITPPHREEGMEVGSIPSGARKLFRHV